MIGEIEHRKKLENNKNAFIDHVKKIVEISDKNKRLKEERKVIENKIRIERRSGNNKKISKYLVDLSKIDKEIKRNELLYEIQCINFGSDEDIQIR